MVTHQVLRIKMPLSSLPSARAAQDRCKVKGDLPMRPPLRGPWNGETRFRPSQTRFACSRGAAGPNGPRPQLRDSMLRPTWDPGSPPWRRVMGEGFASHVWSLLLCRSKSNPHGQLEWSKRVKTHFRLCSQIGRKRSQTTLRSLWLPPERLAQSALSPLAYIAPTGTLNIPARRRRVRTVSI